MKIFARNQLVVPDVTKQGEAGPGIYYIITEGLTQQKPDTTIRYIACRLSNTDGERFNKLGISFELEDSEKEEFKCYLELPHHQCHCIMNGRIAVPSAYKEVLVARAKQEAEAKEAQLQSEKEKMEQLLETLNEEDLLEMQRKAAEENQKLIDMIRLAQREAPGEHSKSIFERFFRGELSNLLGEFGSTQNAESESDKSGVSDKSEERDDTTIRMSENTANSDEEQLENKEENTKTSSRRSRSQK